MLRLGAPTMKLRLMAGLACLASSSPALAEVDYLESWFEGSVVAPLRGSTFAGFQTQQRLRGSGNPTADSHVYRLWLGTKSGKVTAMAGVHRSVEGGSRETRLMQQASYSFAGTPLKGRTRLEQRFVGGAAQTGWRLRQRLGVSLPLSSGEDGWSLAGNAEGFWTLRATSASGQTGLTGLRTFLGFERSFGSVDVELGYTRQQNIRDHAPDRVGHAPTLALTFNL